MAGLKRLNKIEAIGHLIKDYYEGVLELAETNPKSFGDQEEWATSDPKAFAAHQTNSYRKVLKAKRSDELFKLFTEFLADKRAIKEDE